MTRPKPVRDSSAVLLTRGRDDDLEIFLVERSPQLRFFGGYHAVPGGVRDEVDLKLAENDDQGSLRWCGIRELFEEVGVLLLDRALDAGERRALREQLLDGDSSGWAVLVATAGSSDPTADLCRIRTPPFAPVRYETLFLMASLPAGEEPEVWPGELVGGRFWRPADALAAWRRGELLIVPPVLILLELLQGRDAAAFAAAAADIAARYRAGELHRVRFSPGIIMASLATPTLPPATTTNCLLVGEERLYIVDPGAPDPAEQDRLSALLEALRAEGSELAAVVLTHHHPDHSGGARAIAERFALPVRGHTDTLDRLELGAQRGTPIADGDRLPLGTAPDGTADWTLEALFTPGHAVGHLCFRDSRYDALIAGDMISTVSTIVIDPPEGHMATYLDSLERLRQQPITTLYPAHGPAVRQGNKVIEHYLRHRAERQEKIASALRSKPEARVEDLVPLAYDDVDPRMHSLAARSLLAGLQHLSEQGRATERDGQWTAVG
ncbi:MAG: MBL fold metallo-hydrolase [Planctomycetota bacterium]